MTGVLAISTDAAPDGTYAVTARTPGSLDVQPAASTATTIDLAPG